jgi:hypothetical protein
MTPETVTSILTVTLATHYTILGDLNPPGGSGSFDPYPATVDLCSDDGHCYSSQTDFQGSFVLYAMPGIYRLWVWVDPATTWLPPVDNGALVVVNGDMTLPMIQLLGSADRTAHISGQVTLAGTAAPGVIVYVWTDEGDWATTTTDATGIYDLAVLPGHWHAGVYLTPDQELQSLVLPPQTREGYLENGGLANNIDFYLARRNALIRGWLLDATNGPMTDVDIFVYAQYCLSGGACLFVDGGWTRNGYYELRVPGGYTYTLDAWVPITGYLPGPDIPQLVGTQPNQAENTVLHLFAAETRLHGHLVNTDDPAAPVRAEAFVAGSLGNFWVEDWLWAEKDPYQYNLYVPTPVSVNWPWALGLWVNPESGYVADPNYPLYQVTVSPGVTDVEVLLYVKPLSAQITGTVSVEVSGTRALQPLPSAWVYAEGVDGTATAGLYFEAQTDQAGHYAIPVVGGTYHIGVYLPPNLGGLFAPPLPVEWTSLASGPVDLIIGRITRLAISGNLSVLPAASLPLDAEIHVFGASAVGYVETIGTPNTGYTLPVQPGLTWVVWAAYEDPLTDIYYLSEKEVVTIGGSSVGGLNLRLTRSANNLPDTACWTFASSQMVRLTLPAPTGQPAPILEVPAGAMPVNGQVQICAKPRVALPGGQDLVGFAYELEARDGQGNLITQDFNQPVRLSFYLDPATIPLGITPENLVLAFFSPVRQEWVSLENIYVDPFSLLVTGTTRHFSKMGVRPGFPVPQYLVYLPLVGRSFGP